MNAPNPELARGQLDRLFGMYDWCDDVIEIRCIGEVTATDKRFPFSMFAEVWRWLQDCSPVVRMHGSKKNQNYWSEYVDGGLLKLLELNEQGYNVYFGVNPRRKRPEDQFYHGEKRDVERVRVCHADVDGIRPEKVEAILGDWGLKASAIVVTNQQVFGCHVYLQYCESPVLPRSEQAIRKYETMNRRLIALFKPQAKSDDVQDISRILRVPGMVNWPDARKRGQGRVPSPVLLHACDFDRQYSYEDLDALLPRLVNSEPIWPSAENSAATGCASNGTPESAAADPVDHAIIPMRAYDSTGEPEAVQRALAYMHTVWEDDPSDSRQPRGARNCRDMRILAHDFGLGVVEVLRILNAKGFGPDGDAVGWTLYLNEHCKSEFGCKLKDEITDEEMLEIVFTPRSLHLSPVEDSGTKE